MHTTYSDGIDDVELMVRTAAVNELELIAITDHMYETLFMNGKTVDDYFMEIEAASEKYSQVKVLKGVEGTLLEHSGRVSIPDNEIEKFDIVLTDIAWKARGIACDAPINKTDLLKNISMGFKSLCFNENIDIIAHPFNFGRLIKDFSFDMFSDSFLEEIAGYFVEGGKSFEIMNDVWWWYPEMSPEEIKRGYVRILKLFKELGVKFSMGSDSHSHQGIGNTTYADVLLKELL
jgi:histidinol phosphatase-like PHP family hydrolase